MAAEIAGSYRVGDRKVLQAHVYRLARHGELVACFALRAGLMAALFATR